MSFTQCLRVTMATVVTVIGIGGVGVDAQGPNSYPNPYGPADKDFFKLPAGRAMGSTVAVSVDPDGKSVWVFERCGAYRVTPSGVPADPATLARRDSRRECENSDLPSVLKFDASGKLVKSFGEKMIVHPHGMYVDQEGNVFAVDGDQGLINKGRGNQVFKFSPDGKLLLTLGKPGGGDGLSGPDLREPSSVITNPSGEIFVGDGHEGGNARIVKYTKDGKFIKSWGKVGTGAGEFYHPHALAMDSAGRLFVGDRDNGRIVVFDQEGKLLIESWTQFGIPAGLFIDKNDTLYVADASSGENPKRNPDWQKGIRIGSAKTGVVTGFVPDPDREGSQEGVAVDPTGNFLYGAQSDKAAVNRYVKKGS